ncbi:PorT family protein [bacterium SCSIO 12741]|nr:PorT family protein [bacterium SCSIO 12741]
MLFSASVAHAQIPINLGIMGGTTFSKYTTDIDSITSEAKTGWQGGVFARVKLKKFYVEGDALFTAKPGQFRLNAGNQTVENDLKIYTVDVPIMAGYKIIKTKPFSLRLFAGPVMTVNVNDKITTSINGSEVELQEDIQLKGGTSWAGTVGAGVDVLFLVVDARYFINFSDWSNVSTYSLNSNGFMVNVGVKFF